MNQQRMRTTARLAESQLDSKYCNANASVITMPMAASNGPSRIMLASDKLLSIITARLVASYLIITMPMAASNGPSRIMLASDKLLPIITARLVASYLSSKYCNANASVITMPMAASNGPSRIMLASDKLLSIITARLVASYLSSKYCNANASVITMPMAASNGPSRIMLASDKLLPIITTRLVTSQLGHAHGDVRPALSLRKWTMLSKVLLSARISGGGMDVSLEEHVTCWGPDYQLTTSSTPIGDKPTVTALI
ncbi:hypothetical protein J6590_074898 [Homalodisca vitripennis]|nr:hypothetical protein J6590_074898 [Homalodisca vitripennis]